MDLSALEDFNLVVSHGGFGAASRASGRPKATLSRRVRALEDSLGLRLVERGGQALRLTAEGRALHLRTDALLGEVLEAGQALAEGADMPRGRLRVSAPVLITQTRLGPLAAEFLRRYPEVELEIVAEDRRVDVVAEDYDIAIRVNPKPDEALVGKCVARDEVMIVAPPDLPPPEASMGADEAGAPRVPAIGMLAWPSAGVWRFVRDGAEHAIVPDMRLRIGSLSAIRDAVRAGAGAAQLPRSLLCEDHGAGLSIWGPTPDSVTELWVLHASRRLVSPKVAAFVQFLADAFPERRL